MTTFHTTTTEFYDCRSCDAGGFEYEDLKHYSETSGGFCPHCGSGDLKLMTSYIVYQQVFATNEVDAANTAMELDEWNAVTGMVRS